MEVSNNFFHKWIEKRLKAYTFIYCGFIAIGFSIVACIIVSHWGLFFQIIFVDMYYHGNSRSTALVDATDAYLNYYPNRHRIPDAFWITPIDPNNIYFNLKVDDYKIPDWVRQIYAF